MTYIIVILTILAVLAGWLWLQKTARDFAAAHPEFGPALEVGSSCCGKCGHGQCDKTSEEN
jgi:hypothetical protein